MDDLRELDARCAELLGWEVSHGEKPGNYTESVTYGRVYCKGLDKTYWEPLPEFSTDPSACAELDGEARKEGFGVDVYYCHQEIWAARYIQENEPGNRVASEFGRTELEARTKAYIAAKKRAAVRALEGSGDK